MKKVLLSWGILLLCNLMWSLQFTCIKLVEGQVGSYFTVWGPMLVATILLAPFAIKDYKKSKKKMGDILIFIRLALLGAFPAQVLMTWGTHFSTASNAAIITLSLPVISMLFAFLILREKMNGIRWLSFVVAILGVILCSTGDLRQVNFSSAYLWGNVLIFLSIIGNAYYNTGCKQISGKYTEMEMVFYTYVVMILLLTPFVLHYEPGIFKNIPLFTKRTWIGILLLTVFHNFLSMVLFFKALKTLDAMQVALSNYLITFLGLPIAAIWLSEKLSLFAIAGGLMVLLSTIIVTVVDYRMTHKQIFLNKVKLNDEKLYTH